jgi:hypothetical protein
MPILRDSSELNDLNKAKKIVHRNQRRVFKNTEVSVDGGTSEKVAETFEELIKKLIEMRASIFEINSVIGLVVTPAVYDRRRNRNDVGSSAVADRLLSSSSALLKQTEDIINFTNRVLKNNLNQFALFQLQEINKEFENVEAEAVTLNNAVAEVEDENTGNFFDNTLDALNLLTSSWEGQFKAWSQKFASLIDTYNKGLGNNGEPNLEIADDGSIASSMSVDSLVGHGYKVGGLAYLPRRYL